MSIQAVGQLVVIVGFVAWAAALYGLCVLVCLAAHCRQWWAMLGATLPTLAIFAAGVGVLSQLPGSI